MNKKTKIILIVTAFAVMPTVAYCGDKDAFPGVLKRKYSHACPGGTERVGDQPPKSRLVFCRQVLTDGTRLEGDYTAFYRNGNKKIEGEYISGKRDGTWVSYYIGGQVFEKKEFKEGKLVDKVAFSKRGEKLKSRHTKSNQETTVRPETEYTKSLHYKKSTKSTGRANLGWGNKNKKGRRGGF